MGKLKDKVFSEETLWKLVAAGVSIGAAFAVRKLLNAGWKAVSKQDPPENPESMNTKWGEAIMWTAVSSLTAGLASLAAKRGAAEGWNKATGHYPASVIKN